MALWFFVICQKPNKSVTGFWSITNCLNDTFQAAPFFVCNCPVDYGGVKCRTETQGMKDICPVTTSQAVKHGAEHTIPYVSISKPLLRNQSLLVFCFVPSGLAISEGFTEEVAELWL